MTPTTNPQLDPSTVMVVDDTPANLDLLGRILTDAGYRVRALPSGALALVSAAASPPDLILLDILMPDINGHEVCGKLKENPETSKIPVIFISALQEPKDKVLAFSAGGVDYVTKPFQQEEVLARVATHLHLARLHRQLEDQNRELERLATTDPLTGILNRRSFTEQAKRQLTQHLRHQRSLALIMLDIDRFKDINDSLGHDTGDGVLIRVTERISEQLRDSDLFARWGGEEFIILAPETSLRAALTLAERLRQQVAEPAEILAESVTISLGVATAEQGDALEPLIHRADNALLKAKHAGRNSVWSANQDDILPADQVLSELGVAANLTPP